MPDRHLVDRPGVANSVFPKLAAAYPPSSSQQRFPVQAPRCGYKSRLLPHQPSNRAGGQRPAPEGQPFHLAVAVELLRLLLVMTVGQGKRYANNTSAAGKSSEQRSAKPRVPRTVGAHRRAGMGGQSGGIQPGRPPPDQSPPLRHPIHASQTAHRSNFPARMGCRQVPGRQCRAQSPAGVGKLGIHPANPGRTAAPVFQNAPSGAWSHC